MVNILKGVSNFLTISKNPTIHDHGSVKNYPKQMILENDFKPIFQNQKTAGRWTRIVGPVPCRIQFCVHLFQTKMLKNATQGGPLVNQPVL